MALGRSVRNACYTKDSISHISQILSTPAIWVRSPFFKCSGQYVFTRLPEIQRAGEAFLRRGRPADVGQVIHPPCVLGPRPPAQLSPSPHGTGSPGLQPTLQVAHFLSPKHLQTHFPAHSRPLS